VTVLYELGCKVPPSLFNDVVSCRNHRCRWTRWWLATCGALRTLASLLAYRHLCLQVGLTSPVRFLTAPLSTASWWSIIDNHCHYELSWSSVERNVCHSVNGLCPRTLLADQFVSQPKEYFKLGQTVYARVTEIDAEKVNHIV